jgi:hypothetical protein
MVPSQADSEEVPFLDLVEERPQSFGNFLEEAQADTFLEMDEANTFPFRAGEKKEKHLVLQEMDSNLSKAKTSRTS